MDSGSWGGLAWKQHLEPVSSATPHALLAWPALLQKSADARAVEVPPVLLKLL